MAEDILDGTVDEVLAAVDAQPDLTPESLMALAEREEAGKNRSTLIAALVARCALEDATSGSPAAEPEPAADPVVQVARATPTTFTVTQDCVIEGVAYARGNTIAAATVKTFRKLDVLLSNRTLLPTPDPAYRRTDGYGFGAEPRKHPTPTHLSPVERAAL